MMQAYGMASVDDQEIDCYHQYIAQTTYRCERPEDGDHMRMESVGCEAYSRPERVAHHYHGDSSSYANMGYNPMRHKQSPRYYQRNGLYYNDAREMRGSGDSYNRLPGGLQDQLHTWYP